jgi:hypothetical protein
VSRLTNRVVGTVEYYLQEMFSELAFDLKSDEIDFVVTYLSNVNLGSNFRAYLDD